MPSDLNVFSFHVHCLMSVIADNRMIDWQGHQSNIDLQILAMLVQSHPDPVPTGRDLHVRRLENAFQQGWSTRFKQSIFPSLRNENLKLCETNDLIDIVYSQLWILVSIVSDELSICFGMYMHLSWLYRLQVDPEISFHDVCWLTRVWFSATFSAERIVSVTLTPEASDTNISILLCWRLLSVLC